VHPVSRDIRVAGHSIRSNRSASRHDRGDGSAAFLIRKRRAETPMCGFRILVDRKHNRALVTDTVVTGRPALPSPGTVAPSTTTSAGAAAIRSP
jgi:hypothetical protein